MEENNKIIAEFMGLNNLKDNKGDAWDYMNTGKSIYTLRTKDLHYKTDWNWLMEVIEKILNICAENDDLEKYNVITDNIPYIQQTYDECIKFINFYNKQKEE